MRMYTSTCSVRLFLAQSLWSFPSPGSPSQRGCQVRAYQPQPQHTGLSGRERERARRRGTSLGFSRSSLLPPPRRLLLLHEWNRRLWPGSPTAAPAKLNKREPETGAALLAAALLAPTSSRFCPWLHLLPEPV